MPCAVVMANREYEAWFLASIEALRGRAAILPDATSHPDPEAPRDAKGELERRMPRGASYSPTVDQAALTAHLDLESAYRRCRSFRKLVSAFGALAAAAGVAPRCGRPPRGFRDDGLVPALNRTTQAWVEWVPTAGAGPGSRCSGSGRPILC